MTRLACVLVIAWGCVAGAYAQDRSHWGIGGSAVPRWTFLEPLEQLMDIETDLRGTELRVGIVRGRDLGGDWGVMFLRKQIEDGSLVQLRETACVQTAPDQSICARGTYHVTRDAYIRGVEIYKFLPFATIKRRVQLGVVLAGGVGQLEGHSDRFIEHLHIGGGGVTAATDPIGTGAFRETIRELEVIPIGRVEFGVGVLAAPGFKVRVSGGMSFPGYHAVSVHLHYLFGAG